MRGTVFDLGNRRSLWLSLLALASSLVLLGGCGSSERQAIDGTVTLDGTPLEKGFIAFRPQAGTASPSAGGDIVGGRFSIAPAGGLLPGKFRVEITASRITDKKIHDPVRGMVPLEEQFIPAKYNTNSLLEIVIPPGGRKATKNFDLAK